MISRAAYPGPYNQPSPRNVILSQNTQHNTQVRENCSLCIQQRNFANWNKTHKQDEETNFQILLFRICINWANGVTGSTVIHFRRFKMKLNRPFKKKNRYRVNGREEIVFSSLWWSIYLLIILSFSQHTTLRTLDVEEIYNYNEMKWWTSCFTPRDVRSLWY